MPATIAIFDLDGTITRYDCYTRYLLGYLARHPSRWWRAVSLAPQAAAFSLGLMENASLRHSVLRRVFAGIPRPELDAWTAEFIDDVCADGIHAEARRRIAGCPRRPG